MIEIENIKLKRLSWARTQNREGNAGQVTGLFAVTDKNTGEKGHFLYLYDWGNGRDVLREEIFTDNLKLKWPCEESPSAYPFFDPNQSQFKHKDAYGSEISKQCVHSIWGG